MSTSSNNAGGGGGADDETQHHVVVTSTTTSSSLTDVLMRRSSPLVVRDEQQQDCNAGSGRAGTVVMRRSSTSPHTTSRTTCSTGSPLRLTNRPRSNPRTRTPMRYESPIEANTFNRINIREEDEDETEAVAGAEVTGRRQPRMEGQRITIRPMAGRAVGAVTIRERGPAATQHHQHQEKSRKQGPSHRKIRRWNNDNFGNLASEIAASGGRGQQKAAQALLLGQADAAKYRSIYDPNDHRSHAVSRFMEDKKLQGVREKFFTGDLPERQHTTASDISRHQPPQEPSTPEEMMNRIDARLRRILVKACKNSLPASKVVDIFESFLLRAFSGKKNKTPNDAWDDLLLEPPTITKRKGTTTEEDSSVVVKLCFDADSPTGGFNRLLLHGLCQYHGLTAVSRSLEIMMGDNMVSSRVLTASGKLSGPASRLTQHIAQNQ